MHPSLPAEALLNVLQARGLAAPTAIVPVGMPRICATWRLELGGEAPAIWYAHALLWSPGWDPLATAGAALKEAYGIDGLPVVPVWHQPATELLGRPVALCPALPGISGEVAARRGPEAEARVGHAIGQAMARLVEAPVAGHALRGTSERGFVPARATWADSWREFHWLWRRRAVAAGTGLGPLAERLHERVEAGIPALGTATRFALVHRDLHPGNVLVDPGTLELTGVIDWTGAMLGDPVVEWLQPLMLRMPLLRAVVQGFGVERAEALFDEAAVARLELYLATRVAARLGLAGAPPWYGPGGRTRAAALELAQQTAERVLEPGWVRARVKAMLEPELPVGTEPPRRVDPARVARRRALERLRLVPEPTGTGLALVLCALALIDLAGREGGKPLLERAYEVLDLVEGAHDAGAFEPIADRAVWRTRVVGRPRGLSGALAELALRAVDALGGAVDDAVLRGIEGAVVGQAAWEARSEAPSGPLRLALALIAPAGQGELTEAWDALYPENAPAEDALPPWDPAAWAPRSLLHALLPAVRLALHEAQDLPAPRAALWSRLQ